MMENETRQGPDEEVGGQDRRGRHDDDNNEEEQRALPNRQHRVLGPLDAGRMDLLSDELQAIRNLKTAVKDDPDLLVMDGPFAFSDFDLSQIIIANYGNVDAALEQAQTLQGFRMEYDIEESLESGLLFLYEAMRLFPGFFLSLSFTRERHSGHYTLAIDITKLCAGLMALSDGSAMKILITALYFCLQAMNPDLEATRQGMILLCECEKFDWKTDMTLGGFKQIHAELVKEYPTRWRCTRNFNTGLFFQLMMSLGKSYLPHDMLGKVQMGCTSPAGRLDNIYLQPSLEASNERFLERFADALRRRYANAAAFVVKQQPTSSTAAD
ncbi:expressed unknown protein [Seminavis robusta]|uniref:Uncharacterized protein n=1 Tax=Seminavis robusta TaxID=568900 RepID=A0A9N8DU49_9STRA|nr:expressed unknown protein [Seminavis robusta]|eukprot:Sro373_g129020.1 n/a (326) ;mRNA; f:38006-38983